MESLQLDYMPVRPESWQKQCVWARGSVLLCQPIRCKGDGLAHQQKTHMSVRAAHHQSAAAATFSWSSFSCSYHITNLLLTCSWSFLSHKHACFSGHIQDYATLATWFIEELDILSDALP